MNDKVSPVESIVKMVRMPLEQENADLRQQNMELRQNANDLAKQMCFEALQECKDLRQQLAKTKVVLRISEQGEEWREKKMNEDHAEFMKLKEQLAASEASNAAMREALGKALYDLTTSHNLLATDRPDLFTKILHNGQEITWTTDNSVGIEAITKALDGDK